MWQLQRCFIKIIALQVQTIACQLLARSDQRKQIEQAAIHSLVCSALHRESALPSTTSYGILANGIVKNQMYHHSVLGLFTTAGIMYLLATAIFSALWSYEII